MSYYFAITNSGFVAQTAIRIVLVLILISNFFLQIQFILDIELYLILYLGYLLIVPPLIHFKQEQTKIKKENPFQRKFLTVQEELEKAVTNAADHPEDAMGHVRTALNLSLIQKFNFEKITSMKGFFNDAEKLGLPLPGYGMIYGIFNEGSKRLHEGKIHTNFEVSQAINTVKNFIAELDPLNISEEQIDNFKKHSKNVI